MAMNSARVGRALLGALATVALVAGFVSTAGPGETASAISGSDFQPGNIISDDLFYDSNAMSQEEIQSFLDSKIGSCSNSNCLNVKRITTSDVTLTRGICTPYVGASNELVSTILFKVQRACGISAKVLLVTLQKEQGLVTHKSPSDSKLARAMGYGCPDNNSGECFEEYYGVFKQLYTAAWQFKRYSKPTPWGSFQPGTLDILLHPNTDCGRQTVTIQNNATAALYNYTPYTPNAAALSNLRGTGDACSAYGNRNFWVFYNDWFGSTQATYPPGVTIDRIGGKDRYDVSVSISSQNFPDPVSTVYVTTGTNYPDALSAAPAAAKAEAPLLLVPTDSLPESVRTEIVRLNPTQIIVVGGPGSVSQGVYSSLASLTSTISRVGGIDRYEASRNLAAIAFAGGASIAYVATGETYPDALSASAAAGSVDAPVILIPGRAPTLDPAIAALISDLGVTEIRIAGGPASVNPALETEMASIPGVTTVRRLTGADRFYVSGNTNRDAFTSSSRIYLASGFNYPDALSGAAVAGAQNAPLYVIPTTCIPSYVLQDVTNFGATSITVLGGSGTVSSDVLQFARCR